MKKVLIAIVLGLFLGTTQVGCSQLQVHETPTAEQIKTNPAQVLREQLDQANAMIAAGATTVFNQYKAGGLSKDEKEYWQDKLIKARVATRSARGYLDTGSLEDANFQYTLANEAIKALNDFLIKKAAEEKEKK